ncbi:exosome-associated protein 2 [Angomonas deanei]|uniref:Ribosomal RNA-processing protein 43 n=1 Tax=Angomonas deanei TaxID=59799 RepID=S9V2X9_9TRYP|nr:exosome-associated protein 2 [Angomonas deanei]EPY35328.1 exosome-associated protein 2 [Angomonas deanei]CAD2215989.1 hypothetical protein, conserved [Angomonas deanei]|eukprot:EPY24781.1 exosome-associated protein 2 [Angomonas deanei]
MSLLPDTGSVELRSYAEYTIERLANGGRLDERTATEVRPVSVVREAQGDGTGPLSSVLFTDKSGRCFSATVHGVFGPAWPTQPRQGRLNVYVTAPMLGNRIEGSTLYGRGQVISSQQEDVALRVAEGYVREVLLSCLDMEKLCVVEGEACWVLTITITCFHADGGLRPACLHAALAALHGLTLPRARLPNGVVVEPTAVSLSRLPVACAYGIHSSRTTGEVRLLADPSAAEEYICETSAMVTVDEKDNVLSVLFTSPNPLQPSVLTTVVDQWLAAAPAFRAALFKGL